MPVFRPADVLAALHRHGVNYVLIGGLAATLHGSPVTTQDADICPARDPENLERLAAALRELNARIRTEGVEDGLPFACDAKFFETISIANLVTDAGDVCGSSANGSRPTAWRVGGSLNTLRRTTIFAGARSARLAIAPSVSPRGGGVDVVVAF